MSAPCPCTPSANVLAASNTCPAVPKGSQTQTVGPACAKLHNSPKPSATMKERVGLAGWRGAGGCMADLSSRWLERRNLADVAPVRPAASDELPLGVANRLACGVSEKKKEPGWV